MKQKTAAPESEHILKAREKLKKLIDAETQEFSGERLLKTAEAMRRWINRYAAERKKLTDKTIGLFDHNQHSANTTSQYVKDLRKNLQDSFSETPKETSVETLRGRIRRKEEEGPSF